MKTNKKQSIIALASVAIAIFLILIPYTALAAEDTYSSQFQYQNVTEGSVPLTVNFTDQSTGNVTAMEVGIWRWNYLIRKVTSTAYLL